MASRLAVPWKKIVVGAVSLRVIRHEARRKLFLSPDCAEGTDVFLEETLMSCLEAGEIELYKFSVKDLGFTNRHTDSYAVFKQAVSKGFCSCPSEAPLIVACSLGRIEPGACWRFPIRHERRANFLIEPVIFEHNGRVGFRAMTISFAHNLRLTDELVFTRKLQAVDE